MAQGRSTKIILMVKWIRTSRLSIKNSLSAQNNGAPAGASKRASAPAARQRRRPSRWRQSPSTLRTPPSPPRPRHSGNPWCEVLGVGGGVSAIVNPSIVRVRLRRHFEGPRVPRDLGIQEVPGLRCWVWVTFASCPSTLRTSPCPPRLRHSESPWSEVLGVGVGSAFRKSLV